MLQNKENTMERNTDLKASLIAEIRQKVKDRILEKSNADLLEKLINRADNINEAMAIAELGTMYEKTGLKFDVRLEKMSNDIKYFQKNEKLSFHQDDTKPTHKLIIGDNYDALQNLLIEYKSEIDVIYIDPPYGKDSMGEFADTNYNNNITRDNLLSMLYPRLMLAKQLLSSEGVIFCSIDDKNQAYVKCLFDKVFGEKNFLTTFDWMKTATPPSLSKVVRKKFEYILCYKKEYLSNSLNGGIVDGGDMPLLNESNNIISVTFPKESLILKIPNGVYKKGKYNKVYLEDDFIVENNKAVNDLQLRGHMKWTQNTILREIDKGTRYYIKSENFSIRYKRIGERIKIPSNIISKEECGVGTNEDGAKEVISIMGNKIFDFPKPINLIKYLTNLSSYNDSSATILDFFAGSGTTGQAVLEMNKEDNGNRTFILCQMNEKTEATPNGIATEVTAERLKRIMTGEGYKGEKDFKWLESNEPYKENLEVYDIKTVANFEQTEGKSAFDVIDETLYGQEKFQTLEEKVEWVANNFALTQNILESKEDWQERQKGE